MKRNKNFIMDSDSAINSLFEMKEMMVDICKKDDNSIDLYPSGSMAVFAERMKRFEGDLFKKESDMISDIVQKINYIEKDDYTPGVRL